MNREVIKRIYNRFLNSGEITYDGFISLWNQGLKGHYKCILIDMSYDKNTNGKLRFYWNEKIDLGE